MATQLYDVIPGRPFGRGTTNGTISSDPCSRTYCSGSSGSTTLTVGSGSGFSNGDLVLIHQSAGNIASSTEDNWEVNQIYSGGGTTTFTLYNALSRAYTTSTSYGAQIVTIKEYFDLTINGTLAVKPWGYSNPRGGILAIAVKNNLTISSTLHANGYQGFATTDDGSNFGSASAAINYWGGVTSGGFPGGQNSTDGSNSGVGGNYLLGYDRTESTTAQGNGGASPTSQNKCAGAGGHSTSGSGGSEGAQGGGTCGNASLTSMFFGGGGGGAWGDNSNPRWTGGSGGGIIAIWARQITVTGAITSNGGPGFGNIGHASGPGAGGSILINCERGVLGTNLVSATTGANYDHAGAASDGRVRVNYGAYYTGSGSTPSFSAAQDPKLVIPNRASQVIA